LKQPAAEVVREDQRGTAVDVQQGQFRAEVVVEELAGRGDAGVVHQQTNRHVRRGLLDDGKEVVLGKIDRDNPCADRMLALQVLGQLPQPVLTSGDQHEIHPDFSKASCEGC
jgi:hypothetical protein